MNERRPNVLLIQSDQHRYDCVGANGHPLLRTPNLDRLASEGVSFAHAFTPIPDKWDYHGDDSIPPPRTDVTPEVYARHAAGWLEAGARIIGGCREVGPAHISELHRVLRRG